MTDLRRVLASACISLGLLLPGGSGAHADQALFSFGEMRELQRLPAGGTMSAQELNLYRNMEFYAFTVFETLLAANNAALALQRAPLFCAPEGTFRFAADGDIAALAGRLTAKLVGMIDAIGAPVRRPAGERGAADGAARRLPLRRGDRDRQRCALTGRMAAPALWRRCITWFRFNRAAILGGRLALSPLLVQASYRR